MLVFKYIQYQTHQDFYPRTISLLWLKKDFWVHFTTLLMSLVGLEPTTSREQGHHCWNGEQGIRITPSENLNVEEKHTKYTLNNLCKQAEPVYQMINHISIQAVQDWSWFWPSAAYRAEPDGIILVGHQFSSPSSKHDAILHKDLPCCLQSDITPLADRGVKNPASSPREVNNSPLPTR